MMIYRSMRKLYYEMKADREKLNRIYEERLRGDSTCVLRFKVNNDPAFFVVTPEITELLIEIQKSNFELIKRRMQLPKAAWPQYIKNCLIEEVGLTNEMENVHSTRREIEDSLEAVENAEKSTVNMRFHGMVEKYIRLINAEPVSLNDCRDIRELYDQLVLPEVIREKPENTPDGDVFRKEHVYVDNKRREHIHEGVYPESAIIMEMSEALNFLNNQMHNLMIRIAAFHYMFGYVHPFYDGNGRMSRFISSYLLSTELDPSVGLKLSSVIKNEKTKYDHLFRDANDSHNRGDLTDFIYEFLSFVKKTIDEINGFLLERVDTLDFFWKRLESNRNVPAKHDVLWILVQNALFTESGMSINELLKETDLGRSTVDRELAIYANEWNILRVTKEGRKKIYRLDINRLLEYLEMNPA